MAILPDGYAMRAVLTSFITDIEESGGVIIDSAGVHPVAAPSWANLGRTYIDACLAMGVEVQVVNEPDEDR